MKKGMRDVLRMAQQAGVERPRIGKGGKHPRICGLVGGRPFDLPFSDTKIDAPCMKQATICNIRREVRRLREEQRP